MLTFTLVHNQYQYSINWLQLVKQVCVIYFIPYLYSKTTVVKVPKQMVLGTEWSVRVDGVVGSIFLQYHNYC